MKNALNSFGRTTGAGVTVSPDTVYALPAFYNGIRLVSSTIARTHTMVYQVNGDRAKERYHDHPVFRLMRYRWNPIHDAFSGKRKLVQDALKFGNGYAAIVRKNGVAVELWPLNPLTVVPTWILNPKTLRVESMVYVVTTNGHQQHLDFADVIHIRNLTDEDGLVGISILDKAREVLGLGLAVIKYGSVYFGNNAQPGKLLKFPNWFKDAEQLEKFRQGFEGAHRGIDNAFRVGILQGNAELISEQVSNESAQFLESRQMSVIDVSNLLGGVPPHKLGAQNFNSSYSSYEQQELASLGDLFDPWFVLIEQEFENKLLTEIEKESGTVCVEFLRESMFKSDPNSTRAAVILEVNNGLLSINESRSILNRPTIPEDWADGYYRPANLKLQTDKPPVQPVPPVPQIGNQAEAVDQPEANQGDDADNQPAEAEAEERFQALTRKTVERLVTRLRKATEAQADNLRGLDLSTHKAVVREALDMFALDTDEWIDSLQGELRAILPEQIESVFTQDRVDTICRLLNDT